MRPERQVLRSRGGSRAVGVPVARPPPEDSDYVHDEIRQLGQLAKETFQKLGRPTDEAALLQHLQFSGPSEESKAMLRKEQAAADAASASGLYITYRNEKKNSECIRVGPQHACFCGHSLSQHAGAGAPKNGFIKPPRCNSSSCDCTGFAYVPNQPEEIGEGWLSKRKGFDISAWAPKCRCGHGSRQHAAAGSKRCRERGCRCVGFESHFACVVCDQFWEEHETVFEPREARLLTGKPVDRDFQPLSSVDPQFAQLVFATGNTLEDRTLPPGRPARLLTSSATATKPPATERELPPWCERCAAVIRDPSSKFCSQCGGRR